MVQAQQRVGRFGSNLGWHFARQVQQRERKAKENRVSARRISLSDGLWELSWVGRGRP